MCMFGGEKNTIHWVINQYCPGESAFAEKGTAENFTSQHGYSPINAILVRTFMYGYGVPFPTNTLRTVTCDSSVTL